MTKVRTISPQSDEQAVCDDFLLTVPDRRRRYKFRSALRRLLFEYNALGTRKPLLLCTRNLDWVHDWLRATPSMSVETRTGRMRALKHVMQFQYNRGLINENVYELLHFQTFTNAPTLALPVTSFHVMRELDRWAASKRPGEIGYCRMKLRRSHVLHFLKVSSQMEGKWPSLKMIEGWVKGLASGGRAGLREKVRSLELFLNHLCSKCLLDASPFDDLRRRRPSRGLSEIVQALADPNSTEKLAQLGSHRDHNGPLAREIKDYLQLKRATGRKYEAEAHMLHSLDSFLAKRREALSARAFEDWIVSLRHLHSTTQSHYYGQGRQFCEYLRRRDPNAYVPSPGFRPAIRPVRSAIVLGESEIARLLAAAKSMPSNPRTPLRTATLYTMLVLLCCCGMRSGEVRRLKMADINLEQGVLTIRETKFFKTRLVPMHQTVVERLAQYIKERSAAGLLDTSETPLFYSRRSGLFCRTFVSEMLTDLLKSAGIRTNDRRVRVHDLRHSFAVQRLIRWYRQGDDVQAKLPLLSQYMGHLDVKYTVHYLQLVPELCEAAMERFASYAMPLRGGGDEN